jgi:ketosteroid isomerase-like protein
MSQQNIEIARDVLDALNRGDFDRVFRHAAPDAEIDMSRAVGIDRGVYSTDEFRRVTEEFDASWESQRYEADEFIDAGEHVVMPFTNHLGGRGGIEVQARGVWLWTFRDGVIVRLCLYQRREEALEAAGVRD